MLIFCLHERFMYLEMRGLEQNPFVMASPPPLHRGRFKGMILIWKSCAKHRINMTHVQMGLGKTWKKYKQYQKGDAKRVDPNDQPSRPLTQWIVRIRVGSHHLPQTLVQSPWPHWGHISCNGFDHFVVGNFLTELTWTHTSAGWGGLLCPDCERFMCPASLAA